MNSSKAFHAPRAFPWRRSTVAMALALCGAAAQAVTINLSSTGDAPVGAVDPNWKVVTGPNVFDRAPAFVLGTSNPLPGSHWIWSSPQGTGAPLGFQVFRLEFNLNALGLDAGSASLDGDWKAEDDGNVLLNVLLPNGSGLHAISGQASHLSIHSGFVAGQNFLDFIVSDIGFPGPKGLDVSGLTLTANPITAAVPEPSTYLFLLAGLAAIPLARRGATTRRRLPVNLAP